MRSNNLRWSKSELCGSVIESQQYNGLRAAYRFDEKIINSNKNNVF